MLAGVFVCAPLCLQRYRALFALRNKGGEEAVAVLGEAFKTSSALLKHEVAYVMGQMQHPTSAGILCEVLKVNWNILSSPAILNSKQD